MAQCAVLDNEVIRYLFETSLLNNNSDESEPFSDWESDNVICHGYHMCKQNGLERFCHPSQSL